MDFKTFNHHLGGWNSITVDSFAILETLAKSAEWKQDDDKLITGMIKDGCGYALHLFFTGTDGATPFQRLTGGEVPAKPAVTLNEARNTMLKYSKVVEVDQTCDECGDAAKFRCAGCKVAWYCDVACQKANWPDHNAECRRSRK